MRQTNWDGKEVLLVEVPEGFWCYHINKRGDIEAYPEDGGGGTKSIAWLFYKFNMPEGDWQFAFASPLSPTEDEAGEWVGYREGLPYTDFETKKGTPIYYDYEYPLYIPPDWDTIVGYGLKFSTSVESLHSRIKSEGFPHPERVVLLTKK